MTHRTEVSVLWLEERDEEWEQRIIQSGHSVYPICSGHKDNIIGVLYGKHYLRLNDRTREKAMKHAVKAHHFVPESVRADILFQGMKKTRNHFAVVVDDYGGMSGIITMNDLLEELVGDLEDDLSMPVESPLIESSEHYSWFIHGTTPLYEVSKELGVFLPTEEYDTFGNFVVGLLGSVPPDDSTPELQAYGLTIKVKTIKGRRMECAEVTLLEQSKDSLSS